MIRSVLSRLAILSLLASVGAIAHDRSESYSHWFLSESAIVGSVTIPLREVMLLYQNGDSSTPPRELFRNHLVENTAVSADGGVCDRLAAEIMQAPSGFVRVEINFTCPTATPTAIAYRALFDAAPGHVHYAKLHRDSALMGEELITDTNDVWNISELNTSASSYSFGAFLTVGIEHISTGVDHIAFLFGMLLIAGTFRRSIIAITGFTLGHSMSLAAAVLGLVSAESQLVEAFIGFTVALVAVEYFLRRRNQAIRASVFCLAFAISIGLLALLAGSIATRDLYAYAGFGIFSACYLLAATSVSQPRHARKTVLLFAATTCFGLVHGFGFAGFLMDTGILGNSLFVPLLGFNLGVEIGQLILVAAAVTLTAAVGRFVPKVTPQLIAASLCGLGLFWFVGRTLA